MTHPIKNVAIGAYYRKPGPRWSLGYHTGVDYPCAVGTNVYAPVSGYVARVGWDNSFGRYILLRVVISGVSYNVYLCHLSKSLVVVGQTVRMDQHIAESGNTGNSSGPHLHLEVRKSPYGFNSRDIVDPAVVYRYGTSSSPVVDPLKPTVLDLSVWNLAHPKWYRPWGPREAEIIRELQGSDRQGEASIYLFEEVMSQYQIDTIKRALPTCKQLSSPWGLECFYEDGKYNEEVFRSLASGIQSRGAQDIGLKRLDTGQSIRILHTHGPVFSTSLKEQFGDWLTDKARETNADIVAGDLNVSKRDRSPKRELRAIGYRDFKEQATIKNESTHEFIPETWDLCTIMTRPSGPTDIIGGEVDVTTTSLESDHRRIEARVVKAR